MPTRSALTRAAAILAVSMTLAACNAAERDADAVEKAATSAPEARSPSQQAFAEVNDRMHAAMADIPADADEAFMRGMLAHHRGAVEMAQVELQHGRDAKARDLARRIIAAQQAEIEEMAAWLKQRDIGTEPAEVDHAAMGH